MTTYEAWLARHKGEFIETYGFVWECYDDCGCTEAQIVSYYRNKTDRRFRVPVGEWSGTFRSDHESGADAELAKKRRDLAHDNPDREAAIRWQEGVDYDALGDVER